MSSRFIWEQVNPFIMNVTEGRCYVEKVECIEHDSNAAFIEVTEEEAKRCTSDQFLIMKPEWDWISPLQQS